MYGKQMRTVVVTPDWKFSPFTTSCDGFQVASIFGLV